MIGQRKGERRATLHQTRRASWFYRDFVLRDTVLMSIRDIREDNRQVN